MYKTIKRRESYYLVCPEQLGGLSTPRNPVELNSSAKDVIKMKWKSN